MSNEPRAIRYEDLQIGRVYRTGTLDVTESEMVAFARQYDPQPFHLDRAAAEASAFHGLVASGWLTAALTMRLMVGGELSFGAGVIGLGVDSLRWPLPVRPGDRLSATVEVLAMRVSESRPGFGVVRLRTTTFNHRDETVQELITHVLIPRERDAAS